MSGQVSSESGSSGIVPWDPRRALRKVDSDEARLSRGFLRCRPERWFPGFPAHWLPLAHSLGIEFKVLEVKPVLGPPRGLKRGFFCSVDDEPLGIYLDDISSSVILETVVPGANSHAVDIVGEYLARRLLVSLESSWSGPESAVVRFETERDPLSVRTAGAVKFTVDVNGSHSVIWIVLGKMLVERLDGLWRRQIRSSAKSGDGQMDLQAEVAQLAVPPAMLVEYLKAGTIIDLEIPLTDQVTLRLDGKPWLPARMCDIGGKFGIEVLPGPVTSSTVPEGSTRLSIVASQCVTDGLQIAEIAQMGAYWEMETPLSDVVAMVINRDRVAEAKLCSFEGRFALSVL